MSNTKSAGNKSMLDAVTSFDANRLREYHMFLERGLLKQAELHKRIFNIKVD